MTGREAQATRGARGRMVVGAGAIGLAAAAGVFLAIAAVLSEATTTPLLQDAGALFWGAVFALPSGTATFAVALSIGGRQRRVRAAARYGLALALALFGAAVTWWNVMWGISPASVEGAWLWPLAVVPLAASAVAFLTARRAQPPRTSSLR